MKKTICIFFILIASFTIDLLSQDFPEFKRGSIKANGLTFGYIEAGEGPLVLAFHGFPDLPYTFSKQIKTLSETGYRVIAPFMRGYYPTEIPPNGVFESTVLVQDAIALIDAFETDSVILIGH